MHAAPISTSPRDLELILSHDGRCWVARGGGLILRGRTLEEIDRELHGRFDRTAAPGSRLQVCMRFDMAALPRWLRQFSGHYFNRILTISPPETG